jgi:NADH-quinone oxidoreductase subunit N
LNYFYVNNKKINNLEKESIFSKLQKNFFAIWIIPEEDLVNLEKEFDLLLTKHFLGDVFRNLGDFNHSPEEIKKELDDFCNEMKIKVFQHKNNFDYYSNEKSIFGINDTKNPNLSIITEKQISNWREREESALNLINKGDVQGEELLEKLNFEIACQILPNNFYIRATHFTNVEDNLNYKKDISDNFNTIEKTKEKFDTFIQEENLISFDDICMLCPEIFFGLSILFLIFHGALLSYNKIYPLIQKSIIYLSVLILFFTSILVFNSSILLQYSFLNNTIILDNLALYSKQCILLASIVCLLVISGYLEDQKVNSFEYIILILFAIFGLILLCSSNDLLTAYLSIEIQSLSFYLLAAYKRNSIFSTESGLKYFILGALSSSLFLLGSSLIYGTIGATNFEDCKDLFFYVYPEISSLELNQILNVNLLQFGFLFVTISLFFKLALAPFHIWSPDIYEGSLTSSTIFFAVIPKLSLFCLLVRFFQSSFCCFVDYWKYYFVIIALLSILIGAFAGLEQRKIKSLLAYSSISHMGYALLAFSSGTFEGIQALFCYLIIYILSGLCLWSIFLTLKLKNNFSNKGNKDLSDFVLLSKSNTLIAIIFSTVVLSLAGFPPIIGFYVKFNIFLSVIESTMYFAAIISILCSVISTFYYIRMIKVLYFETGIVGNLYFSVNYIYSLILGFCFYFLIGLFVNPNFLYIYGCTMCFI